MIPVDSLKRTKAQGIEKKNISAISLTRYLPVFFRDTIFIFYSESPQDRKNRDDQKS